MRPASCFQNNELGILSSNGGLLHFRYRNQTVSSPAQLLPTGRLPSGDWFQGPQKFVPMADRRVVLRMYAVGWPIGDAVFRSQPSPYRLGSEHGSHPDSRKPLHH